MIFEDNSERTLHPGEAVRLQPGHGFCRRIRWKRGLTRADRLDTEFELLKKHFPKILKNESWALIPEVDLPPGWSPSRTDIAFQIADTFPGIPPYGLYVRAGLTFNGQKPNNYTEPSATNPPFEGKWGMFSWAVNDPSEWHAVVRPQDGANLLQWARSFRQRFEEGV